jgi:hypothetical protein
MFTDTPPEYLLAFHVDNDNNSNCFVEYVYEANAFIQKSKLSQNTNLHMYADVGVFVYVTNVLPVYAAQQLLQIHEVEDCITSANIDLERKRYEQGCNEAHQSFD